MNRIATLRSFIKARAFKRKACPYCKQHNEACNVCSGYAVVFEDEKTIVCPPRLLELYRESILNEMSIYTTMLSDDNKRKEVLESILQEINMQCEEMVIRRDTGKVYMRRHRKSCTGVQGKLFDM